MAKVQDEVVKDMALKTVDKVDDLVNALVDLRDLQEWRDNADVSFTDFEALFGDNTTNVKLKHIDGTLLNQILGKVLGADSTETDSLMHHLANTVVGGGTLAGKTYLEVVQLIRRTSDE